MIKFSNHRIVQELKDSIIMNNEILRDNGKQEIIYSFDELKGEISFSEKELSKLKFFNFAIEDKDTETEEILDILDGLKKIFENTELSYFNIEPKEIIDTPYKLIDLSFLEKLNTNLNTLHLYGIDLSNLNPKIFKRFENLKNIFLKNNNIQSPKIFEDLNEECTISSYKNTFDEQKYSDEVIKLISKHKGKVRGLEYFQPLVSAYRYNEIPLDDYIKFESQFDFSSLENFTITIDSETDLNDQINLNDEAIISKLKKLNSLENTTLLSALTNYSQLHKYLPDLPAIVSIENASELSINDLEKFRNIQSVKIIDNSDLLEEEDNTYTRNQYLNVKEKINEIIKGIPHANNSLGISEKEIFGQAYERLAKYIAFDNFAISEKGKEDNLAQQNCRNLYGGLVNQKSISPGYANILKNVLAHVGIEAHYTVDEDNDEHSWNVVNLDGYYYSTDLMMYDNYLYYGLTPKYFLPLDETNPQYRIIDDYIQSEAQFDFSLLESLIVIINAEVDLNNQIDLNDENTISKLKKLNSLKNTILISDFKNYSQLHSYLPDLPAIVSIENASELSINDLEKFKNIQSVRIIDNSDLQPVKHNVYTSDKYLNVKEKINEIIEGIPHANNSLGISEKEIFGQIYKRLAKHISYDNYAITDEGKKDFDTKSNSGNLYGGLINNESVCAGYANILKNVLAHVGIESHYMVGEEGDDSHAWNAVKLDGEYYNTDLTWDRDSIYLGLTPEYFLKSDEDFDHEDLIIINKFKPECTTSVDRNNTRRLIYKSKLDAKEEKEEKQEKQEDDSNNSYLGKAVKKATNFLKIDNFLKTIKKLIINKDNDIDKDIDRDESEKQN